MVGDRVNVKDGTGLAIGSMRYSDGVLSDFSDTLVIEPGDSKEFPVLPSRSELNEDGGWEFFEMHTFRSDGANGRWFGPITANEYTLEADDGSAFTKVELPLVPDDDGMYTVMDNINGITSLAYGELHTFDTPVHSFTIPGVELLEAAVAPEMFPTFLALDQPNASFTVVVPEPSGMTMAFFGLLLLNRYLRLDHVKKKPCSSAAIIHRGSRVFRSRIVKLSAPKGRA